MKFRHFFDTLRFSRNPLAAFSPLLFPISRIECTHQAELLNVTLSCTSHSQLILRMSRGDLMASKSLTFFDKRNLNWGGLKSGKKLSSVICSFTQQGHFVMSSCPQMKPKNIISSQPRVERRVFQLLRFWNLNFPPKVPTFKPPQFGNVSEIIEYLWSGSTLQCENWTT